jgi:hypothetical protein
MKGAAGPVSSGFTGRTLSDTSTTASVSATWSGTAGSTLQACQAMRCTASVARRPSCSAQSRCHYSTTFVNVPGGGCDRHQAGRLVRHHHRHADKRRCKPVVRGAVHAQRRPGPGTTVDKRVFDAELRAVPAVSRERRCGPQTPHAPGHVSRDCRRSDCWVSRQAGPRSRCVTAPACSCRRRQRGDYSRLQAVRC